MYGVKGRLGSDHYYTQMTPNMLIERPNDKIADRPGPVILAPRIH